MERKMTIGYQFRYSRPIGGSGIGYLCRDLPTAPQLRITNHFLKKISGFAIGDKIKVVYSPGSVTITKLT